MPPISLSFTMSDAMANQAIREQWVAVRRRLFTPGLLGIGALVTGLFILSLKRHAAWPWLLLTGASLTCLVLMVIVWLGGWWWTRRVVARRLSSLPHREVVVDLTDSHLGFKTATERLELRWTELKAVKPLPSCWIIAIRSGSEIPVPRDAMTDDALAMLKALAPPGAFESPAD